jgi:hypothetical protein
MDESRGDHASQSTRCACDREKRGLQWVWGRVGGFEFGSGFDLGLETGSGFGSDPAPVQIWVKGC